MIGRLRGTVASKMPERIVLDVAGVGYEISVTPRTLIVLPGIGEEAVLHTHLHVREDQLAFYGFETGDQRRLFRMLLSVSGVGPKVALGILATLTPDELRRAVTTDDVDALTVVPGIGKRSAQKLMLELRPKLELPDADLPGSGSALADVREALEGLGYQPPEIGAVVGGLPSDLPVEELLRLSLKELGKAGR
ncbi:MAG: Holliday junction branch migration protein RuvA [Acidimicrobiia bacterium]